jgi:hypothetical protein
MFKSFRGLDSSLTEPEYISGSGKIGTGPNWGWIMSGTGKLVSFPDISTQGLFCPSLGGVSCLGQPPLCRFGRFCLGIPLKA